MERRMVEKLVVMVVKVAGQGKGLVVVLVGCCWLEKEEGKK